MAVLSEPLVAQELKRRRPTNIYCPDEESIYLNALSKSIEKSHQTSDVTFAYGAVLQEFLLQMNPLTRLQLEIQICSLNLVRIRPYTLIHLPILDRSNTFHQD